MTGVDLDRRLSNFAKNHKCSHCGSIGTKITQKALFGTKEICSVCQRKWE